MKRKKKSPRSIRKRFSRRSTGGKPNPNTGKVNSFTGRAILRIQFFMFRRARSRKHFSPNRAGKPWSQFLKPAISLANDVWPEAAPFCNSVRYNGL